MVYQFLFCRVFSESVSQETCLTVCKWELPYKVFRADFMKPHLFGYKTNEKRGKTNENNEKGTGYAG